MNFKEYVDVRKNNKKLVEYRSFNAAKAKIKYLKELKDISLPDQERPDFVFIDNAGNRIGFEHFCVDISMGSCKYSVMKKLQSTTEKIYEKYHDVIIGREEDAASDIEEKILNVQIRNWQHFDYWTFCKNFEEIFNNHYSALEDYRKKNLFKIGFLIEFLVPDGKYNVSLNGKNFYKQILNNFPITVEIWQILRKALCEIDFIIIDTNQFIAKKDAIVFLDVNVSPSVIYKEIAPLFKGETGKAKLILTE